MTFCAKIDWVHIEGNWMRSKKIGFSTVEDAEIWMKNETERLSRLPQFKEIMWRRIHDDRGEQP